MANPEIVRVFENGEWKTEVGSSGGGGGSGLPTGWTQSGDPADVNTQGGDLEVDTINCNGGLHMHQTTIDDVDVIDGGASGVQLTGVESMGFIAGAGIDMNNNDISGVDLITADSLTINNDGVVQIGAGGGILFASGSILDVAAHVVPGTATPEQICNALITAGLMAAS